MTSVTRGGSGRPSKAKPATLRALLNKEQFEMWSHYGCFVVCRKRRWYGFSDGYRIWNFSAGLCQNVWGTPGYDYDRFHHREDLLVSQFLLVHAEDLTWMFANGCRDVMSSVLYNDDPFGQVPDEQLPAVVVRRLAEKRQLTRLYA